MNEKFKKVSLFSGPIALAVVLIAAIIFYTGILTPAEAPVARSYNCSIYTEQGCAKMVVASGGEIQVESGGTLDVQSGATFNVGTGKYPLLNGSSGKQVVYGSVDITGTTTVATGLISVQAAFCTLAEDVSPTVGQGALCSVSISGANVAIKGWQLTSGTASTETNLTIDYLIIGTP